MIDTPENHPYNIEPNKPDEEINNVIELLRGRVERMFSGESSGHDLDHLNRTKNIALKLQETEGGDRFVIGIASYLHDIHRIIEKESGEYCSPADSLDKVRDILREASISANRIDKILHSIELHEEYEFTKTGKLAQDIETLILQDADNLDAIGAIGVARAFAFGGAHNIPIWKPDIPLKSDDYDESELDPSEIHHFYNKLLRLKDNMNTKTGKEMAENRHKFMEQFLDEFKKEWLGEL